MGSIISTIADEIRLHGSWEAYCAWRDRGENIQDVDLESKQLVQIRLDLHVAIQLPWMSDQGIDPETQQTFTLL